VRVLRGEGEFLGFTFERRIKDLAGREVMELALPVARYQALLRIVLTY